MCGIGGQTVAEAKQCISPIELTNWILFRQKYGPLHVGMRLDRAVSRVGTLFANMMAGKKVWESMDLSPFDVAIKEANEPEVSFAEAVAAIQAAAKKE